jgi:hypothetical protein
VDGRAAAERTEVLVWYSPSAIHFGIIAYDRSPGSIRATVADRDKINDDDRVVIFLDTFNDRRRAFAFGSNALGVQEDGVRSEGGGGGGGGGLGMDRSQDYLFASRGQITDSGYTVEVRIPFKSLRYPGGKEMTWGFNVVRNTPRTGFEDTWSAVKRGSSSFLAQSGFLTGLHDLHRGVVTEIQPFITASASGERLEETGIYERGPIDPDYGANIRLGFTSLAIDGTINPDFSQIEADAGVVNLNERFALFFDERRPFFLEGIELFNTPGSLVYTRRIANPIAGSKITGKFGRFGIAHLTAIDEVPDENDETITRRPLSSITRVRADIGANSLAGATFTNRSMGGAYNRLAEADARFVIGSIYSLDLAAGNSWTLDTAGTRVGRIWSLDFGRTGRSWGFSYDFQGRSEDFEAGLGFVPRVGDINIRASNRLTLFGPPGALFEGITFFGSVNRYWDYSDFGHERPTEGENSLSAFGRLRGGWSYNGSVRFGFVDFKPDFYDGAEVMESGQLVPYVGPDRLNDALELTVSFNTPNWRIGSADVRLSSKDVGIFSEAAAGHEISLRGTVDVRPSPSVRIEGRTTFSRITRARDGSEFGRTIIPRLRVEVQPDRRFFFRAIAEYRSQRRDALRSALTGALLYIDDVISEPNPSDRLRVDLLLSYQPVQGTVAFLGYGSTYEGDRPLTFRQLTRQNDSFFLKLAYQIRR